MQYLLLIYANESESASRFSDPEARSNYLAAFGSYTESLSESGKMLGWGSAAWRLLGDHRAGPRREDADDRRPVC